MAEPQDLVADATPRAPVRWGLGDVLIGFVLSLIGSQITLAIAIVASGTPASEVRTKLPLGWLAVAQTGLWLGYLGVVWYAARYKGNGMRQDFGLAIQLGDIPIGLGVGIAAQYLIVPLVYVPLRLLVHFNAEDISKPARDITDRASGPVGVILLVLIVGIGAPIVEEIFFRGLLQRSLIRKVGPAWGIGLTAVIFGAVHFEPLQFPALALAGAAFGILAYRSGRLGPSIVAHMLFNLTAVIALLVVS